MSEIQRYMHDYHTSGKYVLYTDHCAVVEALTAERDSWKHTADDEAAGLELWSREAEKLTAERDALQSMAESFQKIISEVLLCDPIPNGQDGLERPWDVIKRVRGERDALRKELNDWPKEGLYE